MLETYGLHTLIWNTCDERFRDVLVASPADAEGRGIALTVKDGGSAVNLTGATVYLVWRLRVTRTRGTEAFTFVSAAAGICKVYCPAAMQEAQGTVDAQTKILLGNDRYTSSRAFAIRVEPVLVGGTELARTVALAFHNLKGADGTSPAYTFNAPLSESAGAVSIGASGTSCFSGCDVLVGGAGSTYASNRASATYFRIDAAATPGYLTAA